MESCCPKDQKTGSNNKASFLIVLCLAPIRFYHYFISPLLGPKCRFEPSCSVYAEDAIKMHGVTKGLYLSIRRLLKCHPWHPGGLDPLPLKRKHE